MMGTFSHKCAQEQVLRATQPQESGLFCLSKIIKVISLLFLWPSSPLTSLPMVRMLKSKQSRRTVKRPNFKTIKENTEAKRDQVAGPQQDFCFLISVSSKPNRLKVTSVAGFFSQICGFGCLSPSKSSESKKTKDKENPTLKELWWITNEAAVAEILF